MNSLFNSTSFLEFVKENQNFTIGLQQILLGERITSLILIFILFNLLIISIYYLSKSYIGVAIVGIISFAIFPIFRLTIYRFIFTFVETSPFPFEIPKNIKVFKDEEFVSAVASIASTPFIQYPLWLYKLQVMHNYSGIRSILVVLAIILIWSTLKFVGGLILINSIFLISFFLFNILFKRYYNIISAA
ncbi:hypothetical protein TVAG_350940 [Trichomonas vaginalis G3]|uniref:Uncharacterized protein n=1 Tax=Trichomonas vaginalis (strain ATCC PRA-98 / G3) TaxID=412133 RepID=A2FUM0_TRIV3|nr:hypothetical protein TVAGG3_0123430 [Trichomonas vaginalis G3]EAX91400.1 hypothetical protein TVAG_350940 [Trichomonas vaginalis G3]KAI5545616.1 hypothetical protein TVAGG3_0123430 [Trichomonas vaginalis G3]|eukprot:XP_001304330.1 hypothetical protein [Trichomonas vaginalis G3]